MSYGPPMNGASSVSGAFGSFYGPIIQFLGLSSIFGSVIGSSGKGFNLDGSAKWILLGSLVELGRRLFKWVMERFKFEYSITGQFNEGDPAYEWILLFLTQEKIWRRSREFRVSAVNSKRKWAVQNGFDDTTNGNADYVPTYDAPQLFRWNGYWVEIKRAKGHNPAGPRVAPNGVGGVLSVTIYTLDMGALSKLVEEARLRYLVISKPNVTVYMADQTTVYGPGNPWSQVKRKSRRPLSSIILQEHIIKSLIDDAKEFIASEDWYQTAGIPHRRGYLLHGPPGTGKTSTIYALAGELGLEIYSLSLSSSFVDDSFLQRAVASIPKHSILLIEDIDCAFGSRDDDDDDDLQRPGMPPMPYAYMPGRRPGFARGPAVSMSGLLNVIDGVGSEEGKLFFATTNYMDKLDSAILRPGRIDKKIAYFLSSHLQQAALFRKFYPDDHFLDLKVPAEHVHESQDVNSKTPIHQISEIFAARVPEHEFSTAEIQGYLLNYKHDPVQALAGVTEWVETERTERKLKAEREAARKEKREKKRALLKSMTAAGNTNNANSAAAASAAPQAASATAQTAISGPPPPTPPKTPHNAEAPAGSTEVVVAPAGKSDDIVQTTTSERATAVLPVAISETPSALGLFVVSSSPTVGDSTPVADGGALPVLGTQAAVPESDAKGTTLIQHTSVKSDSITTIAPLEASSDAMEPIE